MLEIKITCFSSLEVFRPESRDEILLRGEGCNTLGVCHLLAVGLSSNMTDQVVLKKSKSNV